MCAYLIMGWKKLVWGRETKLDIILDYKKIANEESLGDEDAKGFLRTIIT